MDIKIQIILPGTKKLGRNIMDPLMKFKIAYLTILVNKFVLFEIESAIKERMKKSKAINTQPLN